MRPYPPPDTAPMPAPHGATLPPATPTEKRIVDAIDLAAGLLERLAREQDAVAAMAHAGVVVRANSDALATTRGEAARALEAALVLAAGSASIAATMFARAEEEPVAHQQFVALADTRAIPSATLRAWAAGWRALAGSL